MRSQIVRRLERLETRQKPDRTHAERIALLQATGLAIHRGGYQDGEGLGPAYARAIGFTGPYEQEQLVAKHDPATWIARHDAAWQELCMAIGVDPADHTPQEAVAFEMHMLDTLPADIRSLFQP